MQEPGYMRAPRFTTATFGLRLALWLFEKTNNDVTSTASTVLNPLLHVRPPRAGGIACCSTISKSMSSSASHRAHGRGRRRVVKSSFSSFYELTRHIIALGPTCLPLNLAERPAVYNIFAATSNIYPPQIKIYIPVLTR